MSKLSLALVVVKYQKNAKFIRLFFSAMLALGDNFIKNDNDYHTHNVR